tara:strand:- start:887 stop:1669 length:783 start_codon:yes stop_codon:yes gene_type:complete
MAKDVGVVKRVVVTPDKHAPIHDRAAINVVKKSIEIVKPDIYVDLGDLGEWGSVSHWQWKRKKKPPVEYIIPEIEKDVKGVNELLDEIDESLDKANTKKKYVCAGNHDEWCDMFVQQYPYLKQYKFKTACRFDERNYKYYKPGKYLKIGKLFFYHGHHFGGQYHAANHLRKLGCNIMYGHHHSLQQDSVTYMDGPKAAWSLGCLKDMSDEKNAWLGGRQHKWAHAFAVVDYYKGGRFTVHIVQIVDGKASLWGELIDGNK